MVSQKYPRKLSKSVERHFFVQNEYEQCQGNSDVVGLLESNNTVKSDLSPWDLDSDLDWNSVD